MKKLFAILAVAGTLAACNNGGDEKSGNTDSAKATINNAVKTADSATKMMDAAKDSSNKMMKTVSDSANKMMDKAADKMKEAADKMTEKKKSN